MDSPGFSAVKGTYTLMNHETGTLISMQHGDKRQVRYTICLYCYIIAQLLLQVNLKSTNLESHLFKKVLDSVLDRDVSITEVVTDANNQIISIMSMFILV